MTETRYRIAMSATITLCLGIGLFRPPAQASGNQEKGTASAAAQADSFQFSTHNYTNYLPVFLSNGFLFGATTWNGTSAGAATLAGLYDHLQQDSYPYQALIPSWSEVDFFNGSRWLNQLLPAEMQVESYDQQLDGFHALLRTHYKWIDSSDSTQVEAVNFACRQNPRVGVTHVSLTPDFGVEVGPVTVSFPLGGGSGPPFVWEGATLPGSLPIKHLRFDSDHRGFVALSETRDSKVQVAQAVRVALPNNLPFPYVFLGLSTDLERPALHVKFIAVKGQTYVFTKVVAAVSSRESKAPLEDALASAAEAEHSGYESLLEEHERAWAKLWDTDIVIHGDVEAQRVVHAALYFLLSGFREGVTWSVPAMALPSRAYLGRIWWDDDTWIFPSLAILHPELARSVVAYRFKMLAGAKRNAEGRGLRGALFPMESADTGEEAAPEWGQEIHATGDVAMAQWRYFQATGDLDWLREYGYPVIKEVADFWVSRVRLSPDQEHYEILSVQGPNESIVNVDNDCYTNAVAKKTLEVATQAAKLVGATPDPDWAKISKRILILYDKQHNYHPEFAGDEAGHYASLLILLTYPLQMNTSDELKHNDLHACLRTYGQPGYEVGMMGNFYSVVASELGDRELAYKFFIDMIRSYAKPPFYAMTETPRNNRFVFLTGEGAFLQQIVFGFTGLRFSDDGLKSVYPPQLPPAWQSLELRGIHVRGRRLDVRVGPGKTISMTPSEEPR
jgi:trehalose/maltose hydrolase-like predicted phosphorylase